jgi:DNA-binding MarR family transcriptional regulator
MLSVLLGGETAEKVLMFILSRKKGYIREIARFYNISTSGVKKQIDKYENGNVLIGKTIGNTRFYELNKRYPFYKELLQLLKRAKSAYEIILIEELDDYNKRERFRKKDKHLEYQTSDNTNYSPAVAHAK